MKYRAQQGLTVNYNLNGKNNLNVFIVFRILDSQGTTLNDLADCYTKTQVDNIVQNAVASTKPKVSIQAEQNGSITNNAYEWSFGYGGENNPHYGWPCPSNGRIL